MSNTDLKPSNTIAGELNGAIIGVGVNSSISKSDGKEP